MRYAPRNTLLASPSGKDRAAKVLQSTVSNVLHSSGVGIWWLQSLLSYSSTTNTPYGLENLPDNEILDFSKNLSFVRMSAVL